MCSLKLSAKLLFVLADPYYKIIVIFTVAVFFRQQSHIRIWDAETLITLAVLSLQEYNLSISCLAFSQEVCWLRQSLHLIIMHDNKYSDEGVGGFMHPRVLGTMKDQANWIARGSAQLRLP